jgi:probable HAF family extracellular repeat protein
MRQFAVLSAMVLSLLISANAWGQDPPTYYVTDLGPGAATAINSSGQVAVNNNGQAYLYNQGSFTTLGTLGGSYSDGYALNDNGQVAGQADATDGNYHAFSYNGSMSDLGAGDNSSAWGINNAGQLVGQAIDSNGNFDAFLYSGATITYLGFLGGNDSEARAINASGTIAGWSYTSGGPEHGFIYSGGSMHDIGALYGNYSNALAINAAGDVTGNAVNSLGYYQAFFYNGTSMQGLGTVSGFAESFGIGINDAGAVVGALTNSIGTGDHAMLDAGQTTMYDLNNLVSNIGGWTLEEAEGINDSGSIVGFGTVGGEQHAFLLTPVPEPSTIVLSLLAAIGLGIYGWRRGVARS